MGAKWRAKTFREGTAMSNYTAPTVFSCPRCSASIALQGDQGLCSYCGTAVERPGANSSTNSSTRSSFSVNVSTSAYPSARVARRGWHPLLALFLAVVTAAGGFLAGRASVNTPLGPIVVLPTGVPAPGNIAATVIASVGVSDGGSLSELLATLPRDGTGADLLTFLYHSDSSRYTLALIDGGSHQARWQSPLLSKEAYQGAFAIGDDFIFLSDKTDLMALRRRDGSVAWRATLAVEPNNGCEDCMRAIGQQVAVLEKDSTVEVFDAQSGKPAWSTRLKQNPYGGLTVAGERLVVLEEGEGKDPTFMNFLDPATGKVALQIEPKCPAAHAGFEEERPDSNSSMLFSEDGTGMVILFGFFAHCAQSWDLTSGNKLWESGMDNGQVAVNWDGAAPVADATSLYTSNAGQIGVLSLADGTVRALAEDKEYTVRPVAVHDGMLLVAAAPNWDSQRQELWGIDTQTGKRLWQQKLQAHQLRRGSSSGDWDVQLTQGGALVAQVLRDESQLVVDTFDLQSGKNMLHKQHDLSDLHMPSLRATLWADDTGWLMLDNKVFALDLKSGELAYQLN